MKMQLLILSFFFPTFLIAQTQKKFFVEPIINPLLVPIGSMGFEEYGLGYSEFNYEQSSTQEYALIFGRNFFNGKWNAGVGISHKKYRIDFDYMIRHPNLPDFVFRDATRYIDYKFYGLRLFTSYQFSDKFSARLTIEANEPYFVEKSHKSNLGLIQFFFVEVDGEDLGGAIETNEFISPSGGPYSYAMTELNFSYAIYKKLNLLAGVKAKFSKAEKLWTYRLYVTSNNDGIAANTEILNDSRIYPKFLFLYAGLSYRLDFGKKKEKKRKKTKRNK